MSTIYKPTISNPTIPDLKFNSITNKDSKLLITKPYIPQFPEFKKSITPGKIEFAREGIDVGNLAELLNLFSKEGINVRVTSGKREGAKTSSGKISHHSTGDAIDITPIEGETFEDLYRKIKSNKKIMDYMKNTGYGLIDETTPEMLAKTGGTGAHFHIGKDKLGQTFFAKDGIKLGVPYRVDGDYNYAEVHPENTPKPGEHWPSRNPVTGLLLKSKDHPTFDLLRKEEDYIWEDQLTNQLYSFAKGDFREKDPRFKPFSNGVDFAGIQTTNNRAYDPHLIKYISDKLDKSDLNDLQKQAVLASIIEESGGDPFAKKGSHQGILQWETNRYVYNPENSVYEELDNQIKYLLNSINAIHDQKSWNHGGDGSGYMQAVDAYNTFKNGETLEDILHAFTLGYVRPAEAKYSYKNRLKVAKQIKNGESE